MSIEICARTICLASWHSNDISKLIETYAGQSINTSTQIVLLDLSDNPPALVDLPGCQMITDKITSMNIIQVNHISEIPCVIETDESGLVRITKLDTPACELQEKVDCFAKAIAAYNDFDLQTAIKWLHLELHQDPNNQQALFNYASIMHMCGYPTLAVGFIERLLVLNPEDVTAHSFLWALTVNPDCSSVVTSDCYRRLAALNDLRAITKLAVLTGEGSAARQGDPNYGAQIYDDMADKFESKLVDCLGYRGPWLLFEMLEALYVSGVATDDGFKPPQAKGQLRILDVGCGSGLVGRIFSSYTAKKVRCRDGSGDDTDTADIGSKQFVSLTAALSEQSGPLIVGVDVSQRMVEITIQNGSYDYVETSDLSQTLHSICSCQLSEQYLLDLVVAADTFIYIGALGEVFALISKVLRDRGLLIFSTEDLDASPMRIQSATGSKGRSSIQDCVGSDSDEIIGAVPGWGCQLLRSARFAHSHEYIVQLCSRHNFRIVSHSETVLRTEETVPLKGNLYILQKC